MWIRPSTGWTEDAHFIIEKPLCNSCESHRGSLMFPQKRSVWYWMFAASIHWETVALYWLNLISSS